MFIAFSREVALDAEVAVDRLAELGDLVVGQLVDATLLRDADGIADLLRVLRADPIDVAKRDEHPLVGRDVHAGDARHDASLLTGPVGPTRPALGRHGVTASRYGTAKDGQGRTPDREAADYTAPAA
jgi:hypothetical protein